MDQSDERVWCVLHIDDDEEDYILTRELLAKAQGRKFKLEWAPTYKEGLARLTAGEYDAVLVDYDFGVHNGIDLIRDAIARGCQAPIILYTGRGSYAVDMEAMQAGATLYLTKMEANPLLLERSIRYAIERKRDAQERSQLLSSIQDGFFAIDGDWQITYMNQRAAENAGLRPADLVGRNLWEAFPRLLGTQIERSYRQVMEARQAVHFEAQGAYRESWYNISIYPLNEGISVYWQDISERKRAEEALRIKNEALRASEATLRAILNAATESIWLFDPQGVILMGNAMALKRLKRPAEQVIGRNFSELMPAELARSRQAHLDETVRTCAPLEFEDERAGINFLHSFYPIVDEQGQVSGVAAFSRDITQQKQLEARLRGCQ